MFPQKYRLWLKWILDVESQKIKFHLFIVGGPNYFRTIFPATQFIVLILKLLMM